jgi:hypothetical protein
VRARLFDQSVAQFGRAVALAHGDAAALLEAVALPQALGEVGAEALAAPPEGEPEALAEPEALTLVRALAHAVGEWVPALLPLGLADAAPVAESLGDTVALREPPPAWCCVEG